MSGELGVEEWLNSVEAGEGYYFLCSRGHTSLPPQQVCPYCGNAFEQRLLPMEGELLSYTVTNVAAPDFDADTPILLGIASFGPVRVTGRLPKMDRETITAGIPVKLDVKHSDATGERLPVFYRQ